MKFLRTLRPLFAENSRPNPLTTYSPTPPACCAEPSLLTGDLAIAHGTAEEFVKTADAEFTYEFQCFNTNFSSGKKQGEISCFDIAYTLFADDEGIPVFHFLLNDKKELMHDNQLVKIAHLVNERGIQFVASILNDKLPEELKDPHHIILRLSQADKLFKI